MNNTESVYSFFVYPLSYIVGYGKTLDNARKSIYTSQSAITGPNLKQQTLKK